MPAKPALNGKAVTASLFLSTTAFVVTADLLTKWLAFRSIERGGSIRVIGGFLDLIHVENPGAVFGIGQGKQTFFILFTFVAAAGLIWAAWKYGRSSRFLTFGLGCVLGGALGNLWDRLFIGTVRDFIYCHIGSFHWYVFNLADAAICVGAGALILCAYWPSAARREAASTKSP